jgi:hypothetical protein
MTTKHYSPSNGTEADAFHALWCKRCERDKHMNGTLSEGSRVNDGDLCDTLLASFFGNFSSWVYGADGKPCCTKFVPMGEKMPAPRCENTGDMFDK